MFIILFLLLFPNESHSKNTGTYPQCNPPDFYESLGIIPTDRSTLRHVRFLKASWESGAFVNDIFAILLREAMGFTDSSWYSTNATSFYANNSLHIHRALRDGELDIGVHVYHLWKFELDMTYDWNSLYVSNMFMNSSGCLLVGTQLWFQPNARDVIYFFLNFQYTIPNIMQRIIVPNKNDDLDAFEAACQWITSHSAIWTQWIPEQIQYQSIDPASRTSILEFIMVCVFSIVAIAIAGFYVVSHSDQLQCAKKIGSDILDVASSSAFKLSFGVFDWITDLLAFLTEYNYKAPLGFRITYLIVITVAFMACAYSFRFAFRVWMSIYHGGELEIHKARRHLSEERHAQFKKDLKKGAGIFMTTVLIFEDIPMLGLNLYFTFFVSRDMVSPFQMVALLVGSMSIGISLSRLVIANEEKQMYKHVKSQVQLCAVGPDNISGFNTIRSELHVSDIVDIFKWVTLDGDTAHSMSRGLEHTAHSVGRGLEPSESSQMDDTHLGTDIRRSVILPIWKTSMDETYDSTLNRLQTPTDIPNRLQTPRSPTVKHRSPTLVASNFHRNLGVGPEHEGLWLGGNSPRERLKGLDDKLFAIEEEPEEEESQKTERLASKLMHRTPTLVESSAVLVEESKRNSKAREKLDNFSVKLSDTDVLKAMEMASGSIIVE